MRGDFTSKDHTINKVCLNDLLWKRKSMKRWGSWFFQFFECVVGKNPSLPGCGSWSYEGEERKEETGREKGGGHRIRERRRGEGQEVIHRNTGNWRCWGVVLLLKLHHVSFNLLANTANKMRLNDLLWKRKSTRHWGSWFFEFFECIVGKLCRESPKTSNHLRWDFADLRSLRSEWM